MNVDLLKKTLGNLVDESLPVRYVYQSRNLKAIRSTVLQKMRFSDFGMTNEYEFTILGKCSDFPTTGAPERGEVIDIEGGRKRIIDTQIDAAKVGVMIHLGAEWHAG